MTTVDEIRKLRPKSNELNATKAVPIRVCVDDDESGSQSQATAAESSGNTAASKSDARHFNGDYDNTRPDNHDIPSDDDDDAFKSALFNSYNSYKDADQHSVYSYSPFDKHSEYD